MKQYLALALAALALAIAAPGAFATRVIFDPPPALPAGPVSATTTDCTMDAQVGGVLLTNYTPCNVSQLDTAYTVKFVDCSTLTGLNPPFTGWCLFMDNLTGRSLSKFTFQFTIPSGGSLDGSDVLTCGSQPEGFATNDCQDGTTVTAAQSLELSFFAPVANNTNFYLLTDFINPPDPATVIVSVPEPGTLGLFGLGLLALGVGIGLQRRRQTSRSSEAA